MRRLVRCATCGFIMPEGSLGDTCPACGAPRKVFQPYEDTVSETRRRMLDRHIHPIVVHFSSAFAVSLLVLTLFPLVVSGFLEELTLCSGKAMAIVTPLVVIATMLTGILDGRVRFRRIRRSQILIRKVAVGSVFFVASAALALLVWIGEFSTPAYTAGSIAAAAVGLCASYLLGAWGGTLVNSAFAGK